MLGGPQTTHHQNYPKFRLFEVKFDDKKKVQEQVPDSSQIIPMRGLQKKFTDPVGDG